MVPVTAFYAAIVTLLYLYLAKDVISYRRDARILFGDREDPEMIRRTRAFGNFAEYTPLAILLLGLAELQNTWGLILHLAGLALVAGRILHAIAVRSDPHNLKFRVYGMALTLTTLAVLALILLVTAIF